MCVASWKASAILNSGVYVCCQLEGSSQFQQAHPILGCIVMFLALLNVRMA